MLCPYPFARLRDQLPIYSKKTVFWTVFLKDLNKYIQKLISFELCGILAQLELQELQLCRFRKKLFGLLHMMQSCGLLYRKLTMRLLNLPSKL